MLPGQIFSYLEVISNYAYSLRTQKRLSLALNASIDTTSLPHYDPEQDRLTHRKDAIVNSCPAN